MSEKKESFRAAHYIRRTVRSLAHEATEEERLLLQRRITIIGYEHGLDLSWDTSPQATALSIAVGWERKKIDPSFQSMDLIDAGTLVLEKLDNNPFHQEAQRREKLRLTRRRSALRRAVHILKQQHIYIFLF